MTNTQEHAKRELDILDSTVKDAIVTPFTKEILALCEAVGNSGQSGGSNPYTASAISQAIKKLLTFETLAPLTGEDSEWNEVDYAPEMMYQNNRDSRIFKGKDNKSYFIDAIIFDGDLGGSFSGGDIELSNGDTVGSGQYIKEFPFTPKTFYIDVTDRRWKTKEEKEESSDGDWWTHTITDEKQLDEVFEYYNKK